MVLKISDHIAVRLEREAPQFEAPLCEIIYRGEPSDQIVEGAWLEAAVEWDEGLLLFLTNDVPFEETLNIHLLSQSMGLLDSAKLCWVYATGVFEKLKLSSPNKVSFQFLGNKDWSVELLSAPSFYLPWISEPRGTWRKFGFSRHFKISNIPLTT